MEISRSRDLAHPLEEVVAMLLDPSAHVAACVHMGHRDIEVLRAAPSGDTLEVAIVRRVDVDVPRSVRRFVQPSNVVTSDARWVRHPDGTCTGRSDVAIAGLPVRSIGVAAARPAAGGGTTYEISLAMEIGVPVVGPRVARAMRGQLERQIDAQLDAADAWLAAR